MSAYICNPEHIGMLAAYAAVNDCALYSLRGDTPVKTAQLVANCLAEENIRSVAHRYPNGVDGSRPGPCLRDAEIIEASQIYAGHFVKHWKTVTPVKLFKLCRGLSYQSCETDDWTSTNAHNQIDWIIGEVIRNMPGYNDADWCLDRPVPEIEAFYERTKVASFGESK